VTQHIGSVKQCLCAAVHGANARLTVGGSRCCEVVKVEDMPSRHSTQSTDALDAWPLAVTLSNGRSLSVCLEQDFVVCEQDFVWFEQTLSFEQTISPLHPLPLPPNVSAACGTTCVMAAWVNGGVCCMHASTTCGW